MTLLILFSALIQFAAAFLAFRMIKISRHVPGWILIAVSLFLMGIRRTAALLSLHLHGIESTISGFGTEAIGLFISILMLSSMLMIRRYFLRQNNQEVRLRKSEQRYRALTEQLEQRVEERTRILSDAIQRLEKLDRTKSEFLNQMSHKLRTPLNSVMGFSDILLTGMDGELLPEQKKDVQLIFDSARHLLHLIENILDISRIETGKITWNPKEIQVTQAVSETLSNFEGQIKEKALFLRQEIPDTLPPVYADPKRFEQILKNLIGNAVKFTKQGEIFIQAGWTDQEGHPLEYVPADGRGFICISVQDTGIGVFEHEVSITFDQFSQSGTDLARKREGIGLSLTLTQRLVELHGGRIGVESRPDRGSRFWFTFPTFRDKE
jgi:signal transduction histidine kinase